MHDVFETLNKYELKARRIETKNNIRIVDTVNGRYVIKNKKTDKKDIYTYLDTKRFNNYLQMINAEQDKYEIYPYIEQVNIDPADATTDIIYIISMLHNKTTFYKKISSDETKKIYEETLQKIEEIENFYNNIKWSIEEKMFILPSRYLLLRNISIIFISIDMAKYYINKWYDIVKDKDSKRVVLIHNNLDYTHLLKGDNDYLISWDNAKFDSPIYDILGLYKKTYLLVDFNNIFDIYNAKYGLSNEEKCLLFSLLVLPTKIENGTSDVENTRSVYTLTEYLIRTNDFISKNNFEKPENKEDQF